MKIFRLVVTVIFLALLTVSSTALAEGRYQIIGDRKVDRWYFNDDKNYIFCGASMGMGYFVNRSTLKVEKYEPPIYIISVEVVGVGNYFNGGKRISDRWRQTERFKYDYSTHKMYLYTPNGGEHMLRRYENQYQRNKQKMDEARAVDWNSEWTYVFPDVFYGEGAVFPNVGEIAFALAYKLKFHTSEHKRYQGDFYDAVCGVVGEVKDSI